MATTISAASRNAAVNAIVDQLDGAASVVKIYAGAIDDPDVAATQTLLATLTCATPAFGAASDDGTTSTATAGAIADETNAVAGTAAWFRAETSGGACVCQGTVGVGSGDLQLNTTSISTGGTVSVTAWTFTCGQAQT